MEAYGVAAAYLHDIGMVDMTPVGRRTHPQFAAHAAFGPDVDAPGRPPARAGTGPRRASTRSPLAAPFATPLEVVVREMLSLTRRPQQVGGARRRAQRPRGVPPPRAARRLHRPRRRSGAPTGSRPRPTPIRSRSTRTPTAYADPTQSFAWLSATDGPQAALRRRRDRRAAGAAGGGRAAAAGDGAPDVRRVRAVHRRRDGARRCARCGPRAATRPTSSATTTPGVPARPTSGWRS